MIRREGAKIADLSDVENCLINLILAILYPAGSPAATLVSPLTGTIVDIRRGWPSPNMLDNALRAGTTIVRVYSEPGVTRNTTRFIPRWELLPYLAPTMLGTVSGNTVTFSGSGQAGVVAGVAYGPTVARVMSAKPFGDTDTDTTVAAAFAASLAAATSAGPVLTLPTNYNIAARVMFPRPEWLETRRQDQGIRISIRCSDPTVRDIVASAIDAGISNQRDSYGNLLQFFALADGSSVWIRYRGDYVMDGAEKAGLLQRDLCYLCEYPTTLVEAHPLCLFIEVPLTPFATAQPAPVTLIY